MKANTPIVVAVLVVVLAIVGFAFWKSQAKPSEEKQGEAIKQYFDSAQTRKGMEVMKQIPWPGKPGHLQPGANQGGAPAQRR